MRYLAGFALVLVCLTACSGTIEVDGIPKHIALCVDEEGGALGLPSCDAGSDAPVSQGLILAPSPAETESPVDGPAPSFGPEPHKLQP